MKCSVYIYFFVIIIVNCNSIKICEKCKSNLPCNSSLTQAHCPPDHYLMQCISASGCCPGCKELSTSFCSPSIQCAPGLVCVDEKCVLDKSTCSYTYHLSHLKVLPTCETDGTFAALQCRGDRITGRCFCYSEAGERIYGWSWRRTAEGMTCACSRLKHKLIQNGYAENTLHCDQKGNFEPLQCNNGVCWCANAVTGEIIKGTRAVPESMWTFLPCYDIAKMGLRYLRQCESAVYALHLVQKALITHGTTNAEFSKVLCDYDGGYGIYKIYNGIASCQWRDGSRIGSFQAASNTISQINCNCARDQKIFAEADISHTLACNGNGNYESLQDFNGRMYCVDRDGFVVKDEITSFDPQECKKYIYYEATELADDGNDDVEPSIDYQYPDYF